jgi:hypothetical protein
MCRRAEATVTEDVRPLLAEALAPGRFYLRGLSLRLEQAPAEECAWEVFRGRLLPPSQTRRRAAFAAWHAALEGEAAPTLSLLLDAGAGVVHVVRELEVYAWEGRDAGGVIEGGEVRRRQRELVGSIRLADFPDAAALRDELAALLFNAVVGSSRLPLTPEEAPLPAFCFGRLFYLRREAAESLTSWRDLLAEAPLPDMPPRQRARWLETFLHAVAPKEMGEASAALRARWAGLGWGAAKWFGLLRGLFNEVSLSPWTDLGARVLLWLRRLEADGFADAAAATDFLGGLLRQLGRHLTAYDLVTFHHRGANYPDALLLDLALKDYLSRVEARPDLFAGDAGRLRRRALRQAWLLRRHYEGHLVPDVPTSPGENARVLPAGHPRVPEEQLLQTTRRRRRLYDGDPLPAHLGERGRAALRQSVADLAADAELRELGVGLFLDRPFGVGKLPAEPDATVLLTSLGASRTVATARLNALARDTDAGLGSSELSACLERLGVVFVGGVPLERIGEPPRPGVFGLATARLASPDFAFRRTTAASLADFLAWADLGPLEERGLGFLRTGPALLARSAEGPDVVVYDGAWRRRALLEVAPGGFVSRGGREYPAGGLVIVLNY